MRINLSRWALSVGCIVIALGLWPFKAPGTVFVGLGVIALAAELRGVQTVAMRAKRIRAKQPPTANRLQEKKS